MHALILISGSQSTNFLKSLYFVCSSTITIIILQMPLANFQMPFSAVEQKPTYPGPNTFAWFAVVTTIVCGLLNLLSLAFGIPAIVLAGLV